MTDGDWQAIAVPTSPPSQVVSIKPAGTGRRVIGWVLAIMLLLVPGLIAGVGAIAAFVTADTAADVNTKFEGDDDGDGATDEDPPGDADRSNGDPTQIDNVAEAQDHRDDDGDGRVDEDPPPQDLLDEAKDVAEGAGLALAGASVIFLAAFGFFAWLLIRSDQMSRRVG